MATITVQLPADASLVRVARLVAASAARRAGLGEEAVDDVRLAVGEACAWAVVRHQRVAAAAPVELTLDDSTPARLTLEVLDHGGPGRAEDSDDLGLALLRGLAGEVGLEPTADGARLRFSLPGPA